MKKGEMSYKRALITGGAGLVGSHIADRPVRQGLDEIVILDDFTRGRTETFKTPWLTGNVRDYRGRYS